MPRYVKTTSSVNSHSKCIVKWLQNSLRLFHGWWAMTSFIHEKNWTSEPNMKYLFYYYFSTKIMLFFFLAKSKAPSTLRKRIFFYAFSSIVHTKTIENAYIWKRCPEWRHLKTEHYRISVDSENGGFLKRWRHSHHVNSDLVFPSICRMRR